MKGRRYPPELFGVGLLMSLIRTLYIPLIALVLLLIHLAFPTELSSAVVALVFLLWPVSALISQLRVRKRIMSGEEFGFMTDPQNAATWMEQLRKEAHDRIDAQLGATGEDDEETAGEKDEEEPKE